MEIVSSIFTRNIWLYDRGDFQSFSKVVVDSNWNILKDNDIDIYANNVTNHIIELARKHIPNKNIKVRKSDPPRLHNVIQKLMSKKKRLFDKHKRTNDLNDFERYKQVRNKVTCEVRKSKKLQLDKLSDKLKNSDTGPKD